MREKSSLKVCYSVGSLSTGCLTILVDDEEESDEMTRKKRKNLRKLSLPGSQTSIRLATPPGMAPVISRVARSTQARRRGCVAR